MDERTPCRYTFLASSGQVSEPLVVDNSQTSETSASSFEDQHIPSTAFDSSRELDPIITLPSAASISGRHTNERGIHILVKAQQHIKKI